MHALKIISLSVCAILFSGHSLAAEQQTGGLDAYASIALGAGKSNNNYNYSASGVANEARGSLAYTTTNGLGGQLDYRNFNQDWGNKNYRSAVEDFAEHIYYRNANWLAGAFAQQRNYADSIRTGFSQNSNFLGAEGQLYLDNITVYGQLGQAKWDGDYKTGNFSSIELRYFINNNLRLSLPVSYMTEYSSPTETWHQTTIGAGAEYRLSDRPWSFFATYDYAAERDTYYSANNQRLLLGAKYNFGKKSLRQSDRDGASLQPVAKDIYW